MGENSRVLHKRCVDFRDRGMLPQCQQFIRVIVLESVEILIILFHWPWRFKMMLQIFGFYADFCNIKGWCNAYGSNFLIKDGLNKKSSE